MRWIVYSAPVLGIALILGLGAFACGDDDTTADTCLPGTMCPCTPGVTTCPPGEVCSSIGMCLPGTPDASGTPDSGQDADATGEDTVVDLPSDLPVGDGDGDGHEDATELVDAVPDGETDATDVTADSADSADTGRVFSTNPWVAYVTAVEGLSQIHFVRADGTGFTDFDSLDFGNEVDVYTDEYVLENGPQWSPDGTKLAFTAFAFGGTEVLLVVLDFVAGSSTEIPTGLATLSSPSWSPDTDALVVEGHLTGEDENRLYVIDYPSGGDCATPTGCVELTTPPNPGADSSPVWAPDDSAIFFVRRAGEVTGTPTYNVLSVPPGGGTVTSHTTHGQIFGGIAISADSLVLFYPKSSDGENGTLVRRVLSGSAEPTIGLVGDSEPGTFADGERLVIVRRSIDTDSEIVVIDEESGALILRLTNDAESNSTPSVSPVDSEGINVTHTR